MIELLAYLGVTISYLIVFLVIACLLLVLSVCVYGLASSVRNFFSEKKLT